MADEESQNNTRDSSGSSTAVGADELQSNGYLKLAQLMGELPQYAIFRRFCTLNVFNLLMIQAELVMLETQLRRYVQEDSNSTDSLTRDYDKDFLLSSGRRRHLRRGRSRQYKIALRIRHLLKQYNDAFLVQSQLARLPKPTGREVDFVKLWKKDTNRGRVYLISDDNNILEDWDLQELQSIHGQRYDDAMSDWMTRHIIYWYHRLIGHRYKRDKKHSNMGTPAYSHEGLLRLVSTLSITMSSVFPIASILILNRIKTLEARIWAIAAFTILFTACIAAFSPAKRVENFAATMAFAAVQVVFISNSVDNNLRS